MSCTDSKRHFSPKPEQLIPCASFEWPSSLRPHVLPPTDFSYTRRANAAVSMRHVHCSSPQGQATSRFSSQVRVIGSGGAGRRPGQQRPRPTVWPFPDDCQRPAAGRCPLLHCNKCNLKSQGLPVPSSGWMRAETDPSFTHQQGSKLIHLKYNCSHEVANARRIAIETHRRISNITVSGMFLQQLAIFGGRWLCAHNFISLYTPRTDD